MCILHSDFMFEFIECVTFKESKAECLGQVLWQFLSFQRTGCGVHDLLDELLLSVLHEHQSHLEVVGLCYAYQEFAGVLARLFGGQAVDCEGLEHAGEELGVYFCGLVELLQRFCGNLLQILVNKWRVPLEVVVILLQPSGCLRDVLQGELRGLVRCQRGGLVHYVFGQLLGLFGLCWLRGRSSSAEFAFACRLCLGLSRWLGLARWDFLYFWLWRIRLLLGLCFGLNEILLGLLVAWLDFHEEFQVLSGLEVSFFGRVGVRPTEECFGILGVDFLEHVGAVLDDIRLIVKLVPGQRPVGVELRHLGHQVLILCAEGLVLLIEADALTKLGNGHDPHLPLVFCVSCVFDLCELAPEAVCSRSCRLVFIILINQISQILFIIMLAIVLCGFARGSCCFSLFL